MGKRRVPAVPPSGPRDSLLGRPVEEELDLHGHDADSAARQVEMFLMRCSRTRPGAVVRIITGRGNRSAGPAVLQPLVGRLLRGPLSRYVADERADVGGGAFLVLVR